MKAKNHQGWSTWCSIIGSSFEYLENLKEGLV